MPLPLWIYALIAACVGIVSYLLVRLNERIEDVRAEWPWGFFVGAIVLVAIAVVAIPATIAAPIVVALAGCIPVAWSDICNRHLWDDATIFTVLAVGIVDVILGIGDQALLACLVVTTGIMVMYLWSTFRFVPTSEPVPNDTYRLLSIGSVTILAADQRISIADVRMALAIGLGLAPLGATRAAYSLAAALLCWYIWHLLRREKAVPMGPMFVSALLLGALSSAINLGWRLS